MRNHDWVKITRFGRCDTYGCKEDKGAKSFFVNNLSKLDKSKYSGTVCE